MTEDQEGYSITQGPDGRIVDATLSPERAAQIGSLAKGGKQRQREADELAKIVLATLPDLEDAARQKVRDVLLQHYCRHAVSQKGQTALVAIEGIARLIGEAFASKPVGVMAAPGANDVCPLCKRIAIETLSLTPAAQKVLQDVLERGGWQIKAKQEGWHEPN